MSSVCHVPCLDSIGVCGVFGDSGTSGHGADCDCSNMTSPDVKVQTPSSALLRDNWKSWASVLLFG